MTLRAYLDRRRESATAFANRAGTSRELVFAAARGEPVLTRRTAERIRHASSGQVDLAGLLDPRGHPRRRRPQARGASPDG